MPIHEDGRYAHELPSQWRQQQISARQAHEEETPMYQPTIQTTPPSPEITATSEGVPELYVRVNATKNSKSVNLDKTISVKGQMSLVDLARTLDQLSQVADHQLEEEKRKLSEPF